MGELGKAIYLLTPYAMFSKLSSLWEEEEDEERPLLVDDLVTERPCEVIWGGGVCVCEGGQSGRAQAAAHRVGRKGALSPRREREFISLLFSKKEAEK